MVVKSSVYSRVRIDFRQCLHARESLYSEAADINVKIRRSGRYLYVLWCERVPYTRRMRPKTRTAAVVSILSEYCNFMLYRNSTCIARHILQLRIINNPCRVRGACAPAMDIILYGWNWTAKWSFSVIVHGIVYTRSVYSKLHNAEKSIIIKYIYHKYIFYV